MGTLLEAVFAGCVPITTAASGIDDEVLQHCLIIEPMRPDQHRAAIETALDWTFRYLYGPPSRPAGCRPPLPQLGLF